MIRTPDQHLRVFVSSTLEELAAERSAARQAITQLHLTPVMFEGSARPYPPRDVYQATSREATSSSGSTGSGTAGSSPVVTFRGWRTSTGSPPANQACSTSSRRRRTARPPWKRLLERIRRPRHVDILSPVHDGRRAAAAGQRRSGSSPDQPVREALSRPARNPFAEPPLRLSGNPSWAGRRSWPNSEP